MRIVITRTGGFAGIERRAELDTTGRPDATHLEALAHRALSPGRDAPGRGVPDGFHYEITVDNRKVHLADPHLTEDQRELIRTVLREGA
ncbi:protealysin inhibitor emfourin [Streptomyces sp. NPDC021100]|uniref:protealysin inhibitor emfourin n=1 Tax=Streptomyces sp. NPDC021100 TaxID=3365114 RepID=UPI003792755F